MNELTRRRMLWIALVASAGFLLATLLLAATGNLSSGWYLAGAAVYGGVLVLAVVGFLTEAVPPAPPAPAPVPAYLVAAPAPGPAAPDPRLIREPQHLEERVLYVTPRGQVVEVVRAGGGRVDRDLVVETAGRATPLAEVEAAVPDLGVEPGEPPGDGELRVALERWGRIREVA